MWITSYILTVLTTNTTLLMAKIKLPISRILLLLTTLSFLSFQACQPYFRETYREANNLMRATDLMRDNENSEEKLYLKAHLKDGKVYILNDRWEIDTTANFLSGQGSLFDANRRILESGELKIPIDSIAIFETNKDLTSAEKKAAGGLAVLAGLDILLGLVCLTVPKSCFGSCPTFYIDEEDNFHFADAEGFSKAIIPSLEYADIDALNHTVNTDSFSLVMKNEALETHCINRINLLAVQQAENEHIYQSPDDIFYRCDQNTVLSEAIAEEGEITDLIAKVDRSERYSLADDDNMLSKEEILLSFETPSNAEKLGLVLSFRQSLMTTYLIYSALDYMGPYASDILAEMENDDDTRTKLRNGLKELLGGIEIYVWEDASQSWHFQGEFYETGPIAFNHQILPLDTHHEDSLQMKIVLNKGLWRIDHVGLTRIHNTIEPIKLVPDLVLKQGKTDSEALQQLRDSSEHLISMPGSLYRFKFTLPGDDHNYALFLQSQGYYLEWMRKSWLEESNLLKLNQLVNRPKRYLKSEAQAYKEYEKKTEEAFWNSRIQTQPFSYHDN